MQLWCYGLVRLPAAYPTVRVFVVYYARKSPFHHKHKAYAGCCRRPFVYVWTHDVYESHFVLEYSALIK